MYSKLYYLNFNNYANRTLKGFSTVAEYMSYVVYIQNKTNFKVADGIYTEQVANISDSIKPNYLIVENYDDEDNVIDFTRWFIIESDRNRQDQYTFKLKRDICYDNFSLILNNANTLIKKGYCNSTNDAILNDEEEFSTNEYKRVSEILGPELGYKDGWVIMFLSGPIKYYSEITTGGVNQRAVATIYNNIYYQNDSKYYSLANVLFNQDASATPEKCSKGYYAIAFPLSLLNHDYVISTFVKINGNFQKIEGIVLDDNNHTLVTQSKATSKHLQEIFCNAIINNEQILDIQVVPYIEGLVANMYTAGGIDYCDLYFDSIHSGLDYITYVRNTGITNYFVNLPIFKNFEFTFSRSFTLSEFNILGVSDNPKLLEAYKLYLESPDRSSNIEIPLKKFIKKSDGSFPNTISFKFRTLYQPFQSYIYASPDVVDDETYFGYSKEDDGRYLICGYNNQLLRTTNAWISFLLSNKNYLNSFNLQMRDAKINTATGAVTGLVSGATAGAVAGSVVPVIGTAIGAVVGGVVGGTAGLVQGLINTDEKRKEFKWNVDNLKSKPQSVAKVSTFTPLNNIFPTINVYYNDAVVGENGLFAKYLKLNGHTINKIGKIAQYVKNNDTVYVSAYILKLEGFTGDAHELKEIQDEFDKGLYISL